MDILYEPTVKAKNIEQFEKSELEKKYFTFLDEEWIVEEVLLYGYNCSCRNINTDIKKIFACSFVSKRILK